MNKYITTYADGMDLVHINIWDHPTNKTNIIAKCANHEPVMLIDRKGDQSKIKLTNGKEGWCNTAFLTDKKVFLLDKIEELTSSDSLKNSTPFLRWFFKRK